MSNMSTQNNQGGDDFSLSDGLNDLHPQAGAPLEGSMLDQAAAQPAAVDSGGLGDAVSGLIETTEVVADVVGGLFSLIGDILD